MNCQEVKPRVENKGSRHQTLPSPFYDLLLNVVLGVFKLAIQTTITIPMVLNIGVHVFVKIAVAA